MDERGRTAIQSIRIALRAAGSTRPVARFRMAISLTPIIQSQASEHSPTWTWRTFSDQLSYESDQVDIETKIEVLKRFVADGISIMLVTKGDCGITLPKWVRAT